MTVSIAEANFDLRRLCELIERVGPFPDGGALVQMLSEGADYVGADASQYASVTRDEDAIVSRRMLLACDPVAAFAAENATPFGCDESLLLALAAPHPYAVAFDAPTSEGEMAAALQEFRSVFVIPVPPSLSVRTPRLARSGALFLGSRHAGFFEHAASPSLRLWVRAFATEVHRLHGSYLCANLLRSCSISAAELELLRKDRSGLSTKAIARELGVTPHAIDNRFHRLGLKLGVRDRHAATRIAVEHALI